MKILFLGSIEFSEIVLKKLALKYEIGCVISQPNRVKKKGVFLDTPTAKFAKEHNILLHQPEHIKDSYEFIKNLNCDLLVSAAYGQYVPSKIIKLFKDSVNVHGSLLPKYRGGAPIQRSIMNGDKKTGITLIRMAKSLDSGVMFAKKELDILDNEDATSLFLRLAEVGADLLFENIEKIYDGTISYEIQDEALATYAPNILKEEEKIDFNNDATKIVNQIRGLAYNPGAYFEVNGIVIKVFKASISNLKDGNIGEVINTKGNVVIKAKDFGVSLDEVLVSGKKICDGKSFANGQKLLKLNDFVN